MDKLLRRSVMTRRPTLDITANANESQFMDSLLTPFQDHCFSLLSPGSDSHRDQVRVGTCNISFPSPTQSSSNANQINNRNVMESQQEPFKLRFRSHALNILTLLPLCTLLHTVLLVNCLTSKLYLSMIRTSPPPTLLHGSGDVNVDGHLPPESYSCLSADAVPIPPPFTPLPSSPPQLPSSPSTFTTSVSSDGYKLRSPSFRSWTPYPRPATLLTNALEIRFLEKTLRPGGDAGLSFSDLKKSKPLLAAGLKRLPDKALEEAVLMKHASRETRRFRALVSAWELKEARHYSNYLTCMHDIDKEKFSSKEADYPLDALVHFRHEVYNEELQGMAVTDAQLDTLEEEIESRISSSESSNSSASSPPGSPSRDFVPAAAKMRLSDEE